MIKDENELTNQEKLDEMYELTLENHEILRSIRRSNRVNTAFNMLYWLVVIGALGGAYIYVSPLIKALADNKTKIEKTINEVNQINGMLPEKAVLDKLLNMLNKGTPTSTTTGN